jgi:hypothetical protein
VHGSFSVEPAVLRSSGRSLEAAADELGAALQQLRSAAADAGKPWGRDRPGRSFEGGYRGAAHGALTRLASLPRALELAGEGLAAMADLYEVGDEASAVGP